MTDTITEEHMEPAAPASVLLDLIVYTTAAAFSLVAAAIAMPYFIPAFQTGWYGTIISYIPLLWFAKLIFWGYVAANIVSAYYGRARPQAVNSGLWWLDYISSYIPLVFFALTTVLLIAGNQNVFNTGVRFAYWPMEWWFAGLLGLLVFSIIDALFLQGYKYQEVKHQLSTHKTVYRQNTVRDTAPVHTPADVHASETVEDTHTETTHEPASAAAAATAPPVDVERVIAATGSMIRDTRQEIANGFNRLNAAIQNIPRPVAPAGPASTASHTDSHTSTNVHTEDHVSTPAAGPGFAWGAWLLRGILMVIVLLILFSQPDFRAFVQRVIPVFDVSYCKMRAVPTGYNRYERKMEYRTELDC